MPPKDIDTHTLKILKDGKKGGVLIGRKHSECNSDGDCGIKATVSETGQPIEMQTNEVVITAPAVNDKDKHTFDGKTLTNKQILSKINEQGGGVSFAKGGEVKPKFEEGGEVDCGCDHKMEHGGNVSETLSNYEKDLLYGLSFDRLKYRIVKSAKDIQGIIGEGYGYLTHGKAGKELHLTKKGVEYVRQMPKRVLGLEHFKRGGEIGGNHFKGLDHAYPSDFALNQAIEELIADRGDDLSPDEKLFVSAYSGMGGLQSEGGEGHGIMDEYYTPDEIVKYMWALAYKYGFDPKLPILEPSCGTGRFIKYAPYQKNVVGYDISETATKICRALYPKAEINNQSFEKLFISNNTSIGRKTRLMQKYGLAIGNPPYGNYSGLYAGLGEKDFTKAKNWVDYFIFRSLDLLLPGGLLVFIIGVEVQSGGVPFLAQQKNKVKEAIAEKSEIVDAYRLPAGLFERTNVVTDIIVLRKK